MKKFLSLCVCLAFLLTSVIPPAYAQTVMHLPVPGTMVDVSAVHVPVLLRGMTVHPEDPFRFDFIVDSGYAKLAGQPLKDETRRLVNYFLTSMTVPQNDLWVNLSPVEHGRMIPEALSRTELGDDLLAEDYILKQLSSSFMYPEKALGQKFWDRVHAEVAEKYGSIDIPTDSLNKVWITPDTATVYENGSTVYVVDAHLKVMLDADHAAATQATQVGVPIQAAPAEEFARQMMREILLPAIEQEVNSGENFAPLRQIYYSLILAKWYKEKVRNSILSRVFVDQNKIAGIDVVSPSSKEKIYARYMEAYSKGVYNYVKEEFDAGKQEKIERKYFAGGFEDKAMTFKRTNSKADVEASAVGERFKVGVNITPRKAKPAGSFSSNRLRSGLLTFFSASLISLSLLLAFAGCRKDDTASTNIATVDTAGIKVYLRQLDISEPYVAMDSLSYKIIVKMGEKATASLMAFAQDARELPYPRQWALRLLGAVGTYGPSLEFLVQAIDDTTGLYNVSQQSEAINGLIDLLMRQPNSYELCLDIFYNNPSMNAKRVAVLVLAYNGDTRAVKPLSDALATVSPDLLGSVLFTLVQLRDAYAVAPILALYHTSTNLNIKYQAIDALGNLGPVAVAAVGDLITGLSDPDQGIQSACAIALGLINDPAAIPHLIQGLDSGNSWGLRNGSIVGLGQMKALAAVQPLISIVTTETNVSLRTAAMHSLALIGDQTAVDPIGKLLEANFDPDMTIRLYAVDALGFMGLQAGMVYLQYALQYDPEPAVRSAAANAITKISGGKKSAEVKGLDDGAMLNGTMVYVRQFAGDPTTPSEVGGVDMNNINIKGMQAGQNILFNLKGSNSILGKNIDGFKPDIIYITPVKSALAP